jgi:hypothetical protein
MSFIDMMSSARGPGVIGMVMALIVLLGFGLLFMLATDEGFHTGDQSIESIIAHQAKVIEFSNGAIENVSKLLSGAPLRINDVKELARLKRENLVLHKNVVTLGGKIESEKTEIISCNNAFDAYKNQYRAHVRGKAKGEVMETLQTQNGDIYKNVNIREVTAVGVQIRHEDGQKRIPFEELPEAMKDPQQKAAAVAEEQVTWNEHETAVSVANLDSDRRLKEQNAKDAEIAKEKLIRSIAIKISRARSLSSEIQNLANAIPREVHKGISNAPQMRAQLADKRSALAALEADIARMQTELPN